MAMFPGFFAAVTTRIQFCSRRNLYVVLVFLTLWVLGLVSVYIVYLDSNSPVRMRETHFVGKSILRKDSRARTLGLFGSEQCLLLDLDPYHPAVTKHHWDLGSLTCHGGRTRVFLKENKLHVIGRGLRDVSYRAVKLSSGSTNRTTDHSNGVSYGMEHLFIESISRLEKGFSGSIAHYLGKCIHAEGESSDPLDNSGLMLHDGCSGEDHYIFSLGKDAILRHKTSRKCIIPDETNTALLFSANCGENAKFTPLKNGLVQHLLTQKCMHYDVMEDDAPSNEAKLVLSSDCGDLRQRFGWSERFQRIQEQDGDAELVSRSVIKDEFIEVQFISQDTSSGNKEKAYTFQILPKLDLREKPKSPVKNKMNILLVMFHSTSNAQFQRRMPKTYSFLADELDSVFFKGFSVVDESTKAQLAAMLSGTTPIEISKEDIDSLPWLFKIARDNGYVTLMSDDKKYSPLSSDTLDFKETPTDHYTTPFWRAAYRFSSGLQSFCIGSQPIYNITLSYIKEFFTVYAKHPKFALAINTELSSWNINALGYADNEMLEFLKWMKHHGHLDNTAVVMFSDHGSRAEKMRQTLQGKLEERMPFLSALLPLKRTTQLKTVLPNLMFNSGLIVSPYDVYTTLRNIVSPMKYQHKIGENLLDRVATGSRSCDHLQVPSHWCPCLQVQSTVTDTPLKQISNEIIMNMNRNMPERNCSAHAFSTLKSAVILAPQQDVLRFKFSKNSGKCINCQPVYGDVKDLGGDKLFALYIKVASGQVYRVVVNYHYGSFHVHPHIDLVEGQNPQPCKH